MYKRIEAQLVLMDMNKKDLAKQLGMRYNTLLLKLNGKSRFTLDEALELKKVIRSTDSLEDLFDRTV